LRTLQGQITWIAELPTDRLWGTGNRGFGDFAPNGVLAVSSDLVTTGWGRLDEGGVTQMEIVAFALNNGERVKTVTVDPPFGAMRSSGASFWSGPTFIGLSAYVERQAALPSASVGFTLFDLTSLQVSSWSGAFGSEPSAVSTDGQRLLVGGGPFGLINLDGTEIWSRPKAFGRVRGIGQTSGSLNSVSTSRLEEFTHIVEFGSPGGAAGYDVSSGKELWKVSIELAPAMVDFVRTREGGLLLCPTPDAVFGKGGSTTALHIETGQKIWTCEGFVSAVSGIDDVVVTRRGEVVVYLDAFSAEPTAVPPPRPHDYVACIIDGQLMVEVDNTWLTAQVPGHPDCLMGRGEVVAYGDLYLCVTTTKLIALHAG
jgi:outer membrane protein assembly factor BamB